MKFSDPLLCFKSRLFIKAVKMMSATGNIRLLRTPGHHGYSVKFSPFSPSLIAVATGQNFGLSGGGSLLVMDLGLPGNGQVCCCQWQDGLFDLTWSEQNPKCVVSAAGDGSLQMWNTSQPQVPLRVYKEHTREAASVHWSQTRDEHLFVSASWDSTIRLWDPNHQSSLVTLAGHEGLVYQAAWSPHLPGCVASASGHGTLRIWNVRRPQAGPSMVVQACTAGEVLSCDWSKYNQNLIVTSGTNCNICGWDLRQPALPVFVLQGHQYPARQVKCSPFQETQLASVSYDFTTRFWDHSQPSPCLLMMEKHTEFVYGLDLSNHNENMLADCAWDQSVGVYNLGKLTPSP
ncbi:peroxisomal targeting signal 2 receptor-like [Portunus trituberculatus]|uniref:peroxisomal targeting signal 2 receptor-like n=1 Tax=Portunus trituberculatus TaxID=210409 RepID=UPI001E1CC7F2|nr:peroxisomal targeting signal 2 receptor-like [Portunus trituberculatus]